MTVDKSKAASESKAEVKKGRGAAFWILLILVLLALCCVATLITAWFTGDSIVEFLRPYLQ